MRETKMLSLYPFQTGCLLDVTKRVHRRADTSSFLTFIRNGWHNMRLISGSFSCAEHLTVILYSTADVYIFRRFYLCFINDTHSSCAFVQRQRECHCDEQFLFGAPTIVVCCCLADDCRQSDFGAHYYKVRILLSWVYFYTLTPDACILRAKSCCSAYDSMHGFLFWNLQPCDFADQVFFLSDYDTGTVGCFHYIIIWRLD